MGSNCNIMYTKIGRYCSIAGGVKIIFGKHPVKDFVSTHPAFYSKHTSCGVSYVSENIFDEYDYVDDQKKYMVEIGNDVWIGSGSMITGGIKIGDGSIVLAGAVVTKDVEPYSIVGGVPAKTIGSRFNDEEIRFLMEAKWWNWDTETLAKNVQKFKDINEFRNI
ncbi:MAG: CatB-related O-acetyltransferase [Clostridia bacterium]|nr:CatB-related O-acetyltransferase [Clostridia bacterium]